MKSSKLLGTHKTKDEWQCSRTLCRLFTRPHCMSSSATKVQPTIPLPPFAPVGNTPLGVRRVPQQRAAVVLQLGLNQAHVSVLGQRAGVTTAPSTAPPVHSPEEPSGQLLVRPVLHRPDWAPEAPAERGTPEEAAAGWLERKCCPFHL
jgi:hypothetical protein